MVLTHRTIVHLDMDAFFVSVECLKDARLKGRPLIVGGTGDRGVVAACSYEARRFGIHSAMPIRLARRLCPHATFIGGDMDSYSRYSRMVTEIIADKVPMFEKSSIDEFYIDLTGMDKFFGCSKYTSQLRKEIEKQSGLPVSYGLASNKLISKVATDEAKPHGQLEIPFGDEKTFLAPLGIEKIPMIGKQTAALLRQMGVEKVQTLSEIPIPYMFNLLGRNGIELWRRANGIDDTPVIPYHEQKSIGTENTFQKDTTDPEFLLSEMTRMTEHISFELRKQNKLTGCITVKMRYSNFDTVTRQASIPYTACDDILFEKSRELFQKLYDRRLLVRLLGVRFTHLVPGNYQIDLFDDTQEKIKLYQAIDSIRNSFGSDGVMRARSLSNRRP